MIIDLDSHWRENYFMDEAFKLEGQFADLSPVKLNDGMFDKAKFSVPFRPVVGGPAHSAFDHSYMYDPNAAWKGGDVGRRQPAGWNMEFRRDALRTENIDVQLLFPALLSTPYVSEGELCLALCRAYNNWAARFVEGYEDAFLPVAMLPFAYPEGMAGELRRCVNELGMKAANLLPQYGPRNADDEAYFACYEIAQELGVPLFCHPNSTRELVERLDTFLEIYALDRPVQCAPALVTLVLGGVFERFPALKVAFCECGAEWPLYWMHRMDDNYAWGREFPQVSGADRLSMRPSEYVTRNCWVTCEGNEKLLALSLDEMGEDHVCLGTNYPKFDCPCPNVVEDIGKRTDISEGQKRKILGENAARLLNL